MSTRLNNRFTVPVPVDQAWDVLMDVERVAPCMPGATLESVEGDTMTGKVRVKVGPISVTYRGEAHFTEIDAAEHRVELHAGGKEARGSGSASATVIARLHGRDDGTTEVTVDTDFTVTGRVAQFGRGVMADVSAKLVQRFADNLAAELEGGQAAADRGGPGEGERTADRGGDGSRSSSAATAGTATAEAGTAANAVVPPQAGEEEHRAGTSGEPGGRDSGGAQVRPERDARSDSPGLRARDDSIDLVSTVGLPLLKRALPAIGAAGLLAIVFSWLRRRTKRTKRRGRKKG
ncbi:SRPBCC family protein [Streptomonospora wellingtoniae]|uniref:SRPBCC family protein n=1 Tax=Streptomonospora wellingtoniae TaxID=3075544 RepID=A0ABU2KYN1_9ACTN|nr:SRPBCC family protein [Streptomonospora sp. DSM 45055]MDT0304419.1 SRPBCC family protein [Streptomonospora sp. DSM 45055]